MRSLAIILLLAAAGAAAQVPSDKAASEAENSAMDAIARCLVAGLPEDWEQAVMEINLDKPLDETGSVRYLVMRPNIPKAEPFVPCDGKEPPRRLIEVRKALPEARRGWIGAQILLYRDGRFGIRYGYPP